VKLIVSDLDGTFLDDAGRIPELNLRAVAAAARAGVPFVVATGRPLRWLDVLAPLGPEQPLVIASNGALVWDRVAGEPVVRSEFDLESAREVVARLRGIDGLSIGVETMAGFGCEPGCPALPVRGARVAAVDDLLPGGALKLLGYHPGLGTDELAELAAAAVGAAATVTHSGTGCYGLVELSAPGVTKASALRLLCERLGVAAADVVAVGDQPNDLAMLAWSGHPHVVSGAHPSLLGRGFAVVGSSTDGGVGRRILDLLGEA
jgi:hydroxymethylpyrimidine pyrophosphatase-like HAD family hydrolase